MFGLGAPEIIVILILAIILLGPDKFPEFGRSIGRALGEFRSMTSDLTSDLRSAYDDVSTPVKSAYEDLSSNFDTDSWHDARDSDADEATYDSTADGAAEEPQKALPSGEQRPAGRRPGPV